MSAAGLLPGLLRAEPAQALGLLLNGAGVHVVRQGDALPLPASPGELLYAGDRVTAGTAGAQLLYCPAVQLLTLKPNGTATLSPNKATGSFGAKVRTPICNLPAVERDTSHTFGARSVKEDRLRDAPLDAGLDRQYRSELQTLTGSDLASRISRAVLHGRFQQKAAAAQELGRVQEQIADQAWPRILIHELQTRTDEQPVAPRTVRIKVSPPPADLAKGQTFALVVGISKYQRLPSNLQLKFAHADAETFSAHLQSPRGGSIPGENMKRLIDAEATTAAIRNAIHLFLRTKAGKNDTVIVFLAGHGVVDSTGGAYVVTHDSDPEDLRTTGFPMLELQNLMEDELSHVGRVLLYVDVCRAGTIGTLKNNRINRPVSDLLRVQPAAEVLGLLSSGPKEVSIESTRFGGGHGAFSYFLLSGLTGLADEDRDGVIRIEELIHYVQDNVRLATRNRQNPDRDGSYYPASTLAEDVHRKDGIALGIWTPLPPSAAPVPKPEEPSDNRNRGLPTSAEETALWKFMAARDHQGALGELLRLRSQLGAGTDLYQSIEDRVRVAAQDAGQAVVLRYISGEQISQSRADFERGAGWFRLALQLDPGTPWIESKALFSEGRAMIFDKRYTAAADLLLQSVKLNPSGAYSYNALGIALLEQARFIDATEAFQDAARRAPHWAYPLHNLALAHTQLGESQLAIQAYEKAMRLSPAHFYIAYNLGLLYQQLNDGRNAAAALQKAAKLAPDAPEVFNALGVLHFSKDEFDKAEVNYRRALQLDARFLPARQNLAVLCSKDRTRMQEALDVWGAILLQDPAYIPALLSRSENLVQLGRLDAATADLEAILRLQPEYAEARLQLVHLLMGAGKLSESRAVLEPLLQNRARNPRILEALADLERLSGRPQEASRLYKEAIGKFLDPESRKRLRKKIGS